MTAFCDVGQVSFVKPPAAGNSRRARRSAGPTVSRRLLLRNGCRWQEVFFPVAHRHFSGGAKGIKSEGQQRMQ
eukprot:6009485-Alexandrium_andersonii.AAC.1